MLGSFSFGLPVSDSAVSNSIFEINGTEDKTTIYIPMLSGLVKNVLSFSSLDVNALPKTNVCGFIK